VKRVAIQLLMLGLAFPAAAADAPNAPKMYCVATVGAFCISPPIGDTTIKLSDIGIGAAAEVSATGWHAILGLFTDAPRPLDASKLERACAGDKCIRYYQHCDNAEHPTRCDFILESLASVALAADNEEAARKAMTHIGVVMDFAKGVNIPLTALDRESQHAEPPYAE
jgi:hypothetical protein